MLIRYCKEKEKNIFVAFLDYEKEFDYANRAKIIQKLIAEGSGKAYARAIANTYVKSFYTPKVNANQLGACISSKHGITQGKKSSANFFSFYVSDMGEKMKEADTNDFLGPFNLV